MCCSYVCSTKCILYCSRYVDVMCNMCMNSSIGEHVFDEACITEGEKLCGFHGFYVFHESLPYKFQRSFFIICLNTAQ